MHNTKYWNPDTQKFSGRDSASANATELIGSGIINIQGQEIFEGDIVDCGWATGEARLGKFSILDAEDQPITIYGWHMHLHKQQIDEPLDDNAQVIGSRYTHLPDGTPTC